MSKQLNTKKERLDAVMNKVQQKEQSAPVPEKMRERMAAIDAVMQNAEKTERENKIQQFNAQQAERKPAIGKEEIQKAKEIFREYKQGKHVYDENVVENERWYQNRVPVKESQQGVKKTYRSSWLFNALNNKHADFMDNYPEPSVLARELSDKNAAVTMSSILPCIFEQNRFKRTYSKNVWAKIDYGTAVYHVKWDPTKLNGLGDIAIERANVLNLFWKPGVENIQDSPHFFAVSYCDNEALQAMYPELKDHLTPSAGAETKEFITDDNLKQQNRTCVFEWYYKKTVGTKTVLHYVKFVDDVVLYASENETTIESDGHGTPKGQPMAVTGFYEHGKYPYVFDILFPMEGMPVGTGYIDKLKGVQEQIDELDNAIVLNAKQAAICRWIMNNETKLNEDEFADWTIPIVHTTDGNFNKNTATQINSAPISESVIAVRDRKVDELKETGSNRDFANGSTASGVTSGAAIAALQEAGNKTSRDMINTTYDAVEEIAEMTVELVRQFYTTERCFRITAPNGQEAFVKFDNSSIRKQNMLNEENKIIGQRLPIFDIKIKAHKQNPFSRAAQNQDLINLYSMGFFNPDTADQALACLELMDIENKERLVAKISENRTMYMQLQQIQPILANLAMMVDSMKPGYNMTQKLMQQGLLNVNAVSAGGGSMAISAGNTNQLGGMNNSSGYPSVDNARQRVAESAEIK